MRKHTYVCCTLLIIWGLSNVVTAQTLNVSLNLATLHCAKTTERGEDEVYLIVTGKKSNGKVIEKRRLPSDTGHWDMNDHGSKQNRGGETLWSGTLNNNESADITVVVMEEDQGVPGDWLKLAGALLSKTGGPHAAVIGSALSVAGFLSNTIIKDTDDFPGSFHVRLTNQKGRSVAGWRAGERAQDKGELSNSHLGQGVWTHEFWGTGDASQYRAYLTTTPSFK